MDGRGGNISPHDSAILSDIPLFQAKNRDAACE
jgi:hypothetical protein